MLSTLGVLTGLLFRRTWTGWRNGLTGTSWSSTEGSAKSCARWGVTPWNSRSWWQASWLKWDFEKINIFGSWWTSSWMLFSVKKVNYILNSISINVVRSSRAVIIPPDYLALVRVYLKCYDVWLWHSHFKKDIRILKWVRWRVIEMVKELEHLMKGKAEETRFVLP